MAGLVRRPVCVSATHDCSRIKKQLHKVCCDILAAAAFRSAGQPVKPLASAHKLAITEAVSAESAHHAQLLPLVPVFLLQAVDYPTTTMQTTTHHWEAANAIDAEIANLRKYAKVRFVASW
jgi:hypothetical protein